MMSGLFVVCFGRVGLCALDALSQLHFLFVCLCASAK